MATGCTTASQPAATLPDYTASRDAGIDSMDVTISPDTSVNDVATTDTQGDVATCAANQHVCNGACVSNNSVTSCGNRCDACPGTAQGQPTCDQGQCGFQCADGYAECGSFCVRFASDPANCGACGRACTAQQVCLNSVCAASQACQNPGDCSGPGLYCNAATMRRANGCDEANECMGENLQCRANQCEPGCDELSDCPGENRQCRANRCEPGCDELSDCPGANRRCDLNVTHQCQCDVSTPIWCPLQAACRQETVTSCGTSCQMCRVPANGVATCTAGQCGIQCVAPAEQRDSECVLPWQTAPVPLPSEQRYRQFGTALAFSGTDILFVGDPDDEMSAGAVHRFANLGGSGWVYTTVSGPMPFNAGGPLLRFGASLSASSQYLLVGDPGDGQAAGRLFFINLGALSAGWSVLQSGVGVGNHAAVFDDARTLSTTSTSVSTWSEPTAPSPITLPRDGCGRIAISSQTRAAISCAGDVQAYQFQGATVDSTLPRPVAATAAFGSALAASTTRYFVGDPEGGRVYVFSSTPPLYTLQATLIAPSGCTRFARFLAANDQRLVVQCDNGIRMFGPDLQPEGFVAFPSSVSDPSGAALALAPGGNAFAVGFPEAGTNQGGAVFVYTR